jgi:hypothetical protein
MAGTSFARSHRETASCRSTAGALSADRPTRATTSWDRRRNTAFSPRRISSALAGSSPATAQASSRATRAERSSNGSWVLAAIDDRPGSAMLRSLPVASDRAPTDPGPRPPGMPVDDPLRPPQVRASHRHVRWRHLPAPPVTAHGRHADVEVGGDVRGDPPLGAGIRNCRHPAILPDVCHKATSTDAGGFARRTLGDRRDLLSP